MSIATISPRFQVVDSPASLQCFAAAIEDQALAVARPGA
jgi:hypothetical protein